MNRQKYIENIIESLTILQTKVELSKTINLTDINIHSENFYRDFLNLVYGYKLQNLNKETKNMPGIDLGDKKNNITFQYNIHKQITKNKKNC